MEPHYTPNDVIAMLLQIAFKAERLVATTNINNGNQHDFPHTVGDVDALKDLSDELGVLTALPFNLAQGEDDGGSLRAKHFLKSFLPIPPAQQMQNVTIVKIDKISEEGMERLRDAVSKSQRNLDKGCIMLSTDTALLQQIAAAYTEVFGPLDPNMTMNDIAATVIDLLYRVPKMDIPMGEPAPQQGEKVAIYSIDFVDRLIKETVTNDNKAALIDWAVDKWIADVKDRPLTNIHRRTLDGCYRAVIEQLGGDADKLLGPCHDELLDKSSRDCDEIDDAAAEKAFWTFDARVKGYNDWQGQPQDQRMAFKAEFINALRTPFLDREKRKPGLVNDGEGTRFDWAFCERLSQQPRVEEVFQAFADSSSADNATGVVSEVLSTYLGQNTIYVMPEITFADRLEMEKTLNYPAAWDTAAYPTLGDALLESIHAYVVNQQHAEIGGIAPPVVGKVFAVRSYDDSYVENLQVMVADISSDGRRFRACAHLFALANSDDVQLQQDVQAVVNEVIPLAKQMENYIPSLAEVREIIDRLVQHGLIADDTAPERNVNLYATWEVMRQDALKIARMIVEQYREPVAMQRVICKHCCAIMPDDEKDTLSEKHAADCVVNAARQFIEDTDV